MKSKEQRMHRRREMSRTWLRARLLAWTRGVSWCFTKTHKAAAMRTQKQSAVHASDIARDSSKATKVRTLGRQRFLFLLGYSWSGHWTQCCAPGEKDVAFHFHDSFLSI